MNKILVFLTLVILLSSITFAVTMDDASSAISTAKNDIQEMINADFKVAYVNDMMIVINDAFASGKYDIVLEKTKLISDRKDMAFEINDELRSIELRINDDIVRGIDISVANLSYENAKTEFNNENYERANIYIEQTNSELSSAEAYTSLLRARVERLQANIFYFVAYNWKEILFTIIVVSIIGFLLYKRYYKIYLKKKIENYKKRKNILKKMIVQAQIDRYKKRILSEDVYIMKIKQYKDGIIEIDDIINVLNLKLKKAN